MAATLVGTVWQDLNSDGQQTGGEPAVQFAVAELFSSANGTIGDSDDVSLGTQITDSAGNYQFTGLAAGVNHYVAVRPPVGFAFTAQDTGPDATDSDVGATTGRSAMFAPVDLSTVDLDAGLTGAAPGFGWAAQQGNTSVDEGRALQPLMRGEQAAWREYLFSEMNFHTPDFVRLQRSVRDGRHKLLLTLNPRANEPRLGLYDLRDDPWEKRNLVHNPALAPVKQKLEAALLQWRQETADPLLDDARAQRWIAAAKKWGSGPREKVGNKRVVSVPPGDLKLLE